MEVENSVFIPYNVPSLKNSKVATSKGVFASKTVGKYLRKHGIAHYSSSRKEVKRYQTIPMTFPVKELKTLFADREYPIIVGLHFVRDSKRDFDFNNASQIIFDLLTAFDIIPDDSMTYVIPSCLWVDERHYTVDKDNPGVFIKLLSA